MRQKIRTAMLALGLGFGVVILEAAAVPSLDAQGVCFCMRNRPSTGECNVPAVEPCDCWYCPE